MFQNARDYLSDVRGEFRKITWPNQREYVGGTVGVVIIVAFLTLVLGLIDAGLFEALGVFAILAFQKAQFAIDAAHLDLGHVQIPQFRLGRLEFLVE